MSILCWNCQGLGRTRAVRPLCDLTKCESPVVVLLQETKLSSQKAAKLQWELGYGNMLSILARGRSGGLLMFWRSDMSMTLRSFSHSHIDALVEGKDGGASYRLTNVYGEPQAELRHKF